MEITYKTEISELINVGQIQEQTSIIEKVIDEYSDKGDEILRKELSTNLSENTFYYGTNHLIFDKATKLCMSFSNIDKSVLAIIISKAKEKREEELTILREKVQERIKEIDAQLRDNLYNIRNLLISTNPEDSIKLNEIKRINRELISEKQELEKKIENIDSELGGL